MDNSRKDIDKLMKDRGDNVKRNKFRLKKDVKIKRDCGDYDKIRSNYDKSSECDRKFETKHETGKNSEASKRQSEYEKENKRILDIRRRIRDKYTIKNYLGQDVNKPNNARDCNADNKKDVPLSKQEEKEKICSTKSDKTFKIEKENQKNDKIPVIKTITTKNDSRVYKAVTFTSPKQNPVTALQINIPTGTKTHLNRIPTLIHQNKLKTASKTSVKATSAKKSGKKSKRLKSVPSPISKIGESPPTEVAKWAPDCINKHTRPYYEAWVNTTLTAISKDCKGNYISKQKLIKSFQKALDRVDSTEFVYTDEQNLGRIKINHSEVKWSQNYPEKK